jgi:hypothetical protein
MAAVVRRVAGKRPLALQMTEGVTCTSLALHLANPQGNQAKLSQEDFGLP